MSLGSLRFEALGPLTVVGGEEKVSLRPAHRRLLASLLLEPGSWVGTDTLIDRIWGEEPPATARNSLHVHVSAIRRQISGAVVSGPDGYFLDLAGNVFDVTEFTDRVAAATSSMEHGHFREAADMAARALDMWRGRPYHELDDVDAALAERARLAELSTSASITLARSLTLMGRVSESIAHLRRNLAESPYDEAVWEELIHGYYLAGRQVDALAAYTEAKTVLGENLGLEPGPRLRALEERILLHDPALMPPGRAAHNLPRIESSFVGREHDLEGVLGLLGRHRLVTITGGPGIGKTRLALESASRLLDDHPGGVWFVRLAEAGGEAAAAATISSAMSITDGVPSLAELGERLDTRPALLVLDNCEHLVPQMRRFLAARDGAGALRVLATSRIRLGLEDEVVWPLQELPLPASTEDMWQSPAAQLLADRIATTDPRVAVDTLDPEGLLEVCTRSGGVPLALELAARWIPSVELATAASQTLAAPPAWHDADPAHHGSLLEAIEWSASLLDDSTRRAFENAGMFPSAFTAEAFARVCTPRLPTAVPILSGLVEASLLIPEHSDGFRYRMLEPLRDYGYMQMRARRRTSGVARRHADWFLEQARAAASQTASDVDASGTVRRDLPDYRLAMRYLLDHGRPADAAEIAISLSSFWISQYLGWEGQEWLEECIDHDLEGDTLLRALEAGGRIAFFIAEYQKSADFYALLRKAAGDDPAWGAEALYGMGRVMVHFEPPSGIQVLEDAIEAFEEAGDADRVAECRVVLGRQAAAAARIDEARELLHRALDDLSHLDHPQWEAVAHRHLSMIAWYEGEEAVARTELEIALELAASCPDRRVYSGVLIQKALVEATWETPEKAAATLLEGLEMVADQHEIYFCLLAFPALPVLSAVGDWDMAARLLAHFDRIYRRHGWADHDSRVAAAAEYRKRIAEGAADAGLSPDRLAPVPTARIAADLTASLERIGAGRG